MVEALEGLRGVPSTVAATLVAELGDLARFENARQVMKYLGLACLQIMSTDLNELICKIPRAVSKLAIMSVDTPAE